MTDAGVTDAGVTDGVATTMSRKAIAAEIRLFKTWPARVGAIAFVLLAIAAPLVISNVFILSLLVLSGITAIAAIGLNIAMGYAGQLSLGHSAFLAVGAYAACVLGINLHLPFIVWLLGTVVITGLLGAFVGLFTLRLRGPYLAIVSIGLVFFFMYLFNNWESVSGGPNGRSTQLPMSLGVFDFNQPVVAGTPYGRNQGLAIICWLLVGLCVLVTHNIMRGGFGRSVLTIRAQDIAAEVLGVRPFRTKVIALAVGSAMAGAAGALLVNELQFALPSGFDLNMSIQYVAIIVLGGMATPWGPVIGAIFVTAIPQLLSLYGADIPFVKDPGESGFGVNKDNAGLLIYGVLVIITLLAIPEGLVGIGERVRSLLLRLTHRRGGNQPKEMDAQ